MVSFAFIDSKSLGGGRHPKPIGYQDIPVSIATGVTVMNPSNVRKCVGAVVRFEGGPFRERHDGGLPVASASILTASGYPRNDGDEYFFGREEALLFAVILDTLGPLVATEGILRVTYYG
jgi:hypothetical protein